MPEVLSRLQQQFSELWTNLDKSQKNRIYITSAVLVIAIATAIILLTRPNYTPLINDANPKDVGEMIKILDEKKISYKVGDGNTSIITNTSDRSKAKAALIQKGYPKGNMTFADAFGMIKITSNESEKKKLWNRYDEEKIADNIKALDNIKDARVALALPEENPFLVEDKEQKKPTAIVTVTPREELTPIQIKGIVMMAASSVVGLNPKDVTVLDNNGNILSSEAGDALTSQTNTQEGLRLKRKKELEKNIATMFAGQFDNFDNLRVVANPYLDFNTKKTQASTVAKPDGMDGGAIVNKEVIKENLTNVGVNGAPAMDSNPGGAAAPSYQIGGEGNSSYTKSHEVDSYKYTEALINEEKALGEMVAEKSFVAVTLLYGNRVADDSKLTPEFINQLRDGISKATYGIPTANISINRYRVAPPAPETKPISDTVKELFNTYGLFALMLLLIIGLMFAAVPKKKPVLEPEMGMPLQAATASGPRFIVPEAPSEPIPEIELEERSEVKKQIEKFVKQKPDAVAQLLRNWLSDEWD